MQYRYLVSYGLHKPISSFTFDLVAFPSLLSPSSRFLDCGTRGAVKGVSVSYKARPYPRTVSPLTPPSSLLYPYPFVNLLRSLSLLLRYP